MKVNEWIKSARTQAKLTQSKLGDEIGRTKGNISAWELGSHEPSFSQMIEISRITGVEIPGIAVLKDRTGHTKLPVLEVSPSAGSGHEPQDYPAVIDYLEVPEAWAQHKLGRDLSKYRVLPVSGDSMSPTINDGDLVFVDTNVRSFDTEGIYVIIWNDRLLIKRLRVALATQRVEIRSDNEDKYGTETVSIDEAARLHICGFVRCWWSIKTA